MLAELERELTAHGVKNDVAHGLVAFLESIDTYRFGGAAQDQSSRSSLLQKTGEFIRELDKTKKGGNS
jgi:hypothetical protein